MRRFCAALCGLLVAWPIVGIAQDADDTSADIPSSVTTPEGAIVEPLFQTGYASADRVRDVAGPASIIMDKCEPTTGADDPRVVQIGVSKAGDLDIDVLNTLFVEAVQFVWAQCPRPFFDIVSGQQSGHFHYDVGEVQIIGPDGVPEYQAMLGGGNLGGVGDMAFAPGQKYQWQRFRNLTSERAAQAAATADAAARQAAIDQAQQAAAAADSARQKTFDDQTNSFFAGVWLLIRSLALIGLALWVLSNWANILRFFYGLTPHPAAGDVHRVIASGRPHDSERFRRLLAIAPGNAIEREVRARQAAELSRRLAAHAQQIRAEFDEEAAYLKRQAELGEDAATHANIKRRLDTILRAQGKTP